jgi:hypothetical protein
MKVAFTFGPGGANEDPAWMISFYERNSEVRLCAPVPGKRMPCAGMVQYAIICLSVTSMTTTHLC